MQPTYQSTHSRAILNPSRFFSNRTLPSLNLGKQRTWVLRQVSNLNFYFSQTMATEIVSDWLRRRLPIKAILRKILFTAGPTWACVLHCQNFVHTFFRIRSSMVLLFKDSASISKWPDNAIVCGPLGRQIPATGLFSEKNSLVWI